ncbi:MAG: efflux RND transporter permease subunit [Clostridium sp.]|nr:efflux RND transporter permease subunit [Clostridium sp.]
MAVNNRLAVLVFAAAIMIAGMVVTLNSDVDIFPDLNAPTVTVMTEAPGMNPEEVENSITFPLESALNGATGVRRISSSSTAGFSVIKVEFDWGTDDYAARQIVAEKLSAASAELPSSARQPVLGPQSSILGEIMLVGLTSDSIAPLDLRDIADRTVAPRLRSIPGVAQVSVMGSSPRQYDIVLSPQRMMALGLTLDETLAALSGMNANVAGGSLDSRGINYNVKTSMNTPDTGELGETVIATADDGTSVRLADIAEVRIDGARPRLGSTAVNGRSAVLLTIVKQHNGSTEKLTSEVDRTLGSILAPYGGAISCDTSLFRQNDFITSSVGNLQTSLFEGAIFVVIVLFVFLMNLRTTIISVVALPVSVIVTVLILHLLGISINTMTLGGIAIAIGSLVDDAIVDVENVHRRLRENNLLPETKRGSVASVVRAASAEVRLPILNSSLIIVASFLPLFFLGGLEGRLLMPLGIAFITALAASTLVALTLTPALCVYLLGTRRASDPEKEQQDPPLSRWLQSRYIAALRRALASPRPIMICVAAALILSVALFFTMGRNFLPPFNEGSLTINISAPAGTSIETSDSIGAIAERLILSHPSVRSTARKTGRAELDEHSRGVNASEIEVAFRPEVPHSFRALVTDSIRRELSSIPGCVVEIGQPITHRINAMLSGSEGQIAVKISGPDLNRLSDIGKQVRRAMGDIDGLVDISLPPVAESPRFDIRPRRGMLASYGVTPAEFATTVEAALNGLKVSDVRDRGYTYDIIARYGDIHGSDASTNPVGYLADIPVDTRRGKVPLSNLADIMPSMGPDDISRENISRQIVVSANVDGRDLRGTVAKLRGAVAEAVSLPDGYMIDYGGQFENEERTTRTLALASLGALLLICLILYNEYRNLRSTMIILVNIPLALIGGVVLLWLTYREINIPAIIGFISLMGITTRNGMLLMSRYDRLRRHGVSLGDRIEKGSRERLLPIVMTALTSALALVPLALRGNEPGNEIQSPMAVVILGGLLTSTILNIFVVPILYRSGYK